MASAEEQTTQHLSDEQHALVVLHLFAHIEPETDTKAIAVALDDLRARGGQVINVAMLGHKADIGLMLLSTDVSSLRQTQFALSAAGASIAYSYLSMTEVSEYAKTIPDDMRAMRLNPQLPPAELKVFCFYPMSKKRDGKDNWYRLSYDERLGLMYGHGGAGRAFKGRVLQVITGSTGLDEFEWGVTLFARTLEDIKDCVYTMRFDEASARYAVFGPFLVGTVMAENEFFDAIEVLA